MKKVAQGRSQARTVLIVGEGNAEEAFLRHLKSLYVTRNCGVSVTVKNAHGRTAAHVIEYAYRQRRNADYDVIAALFDTDVGWTGETQSLAKKQKVLPLPCTPCIEALLLTCKSHKVAGMNSEQLKTKFKLIFGCEASDLNVAMHFNQHLLEASALNVPTLKLLIQLLQTGTPG